MKQLDTFERLHSLTLLVNEAAKANNFDEAERLLAERQKLLDELESPTLDPLRLGLIQELDSNSLDLISEAKRDLVRERQTSTAAKKAVGQYRQTAFGVHSV